MRPISKSYKRDFQYAHLRYIKLNMSDRLPPLTALRAFEAAARHLSFAKAATELNVTPAALSFQIKSLEDHFGAPLFHRLNRAVALTEAGAMLSPGTSAGFDRLGQAWADAKRVNDTKTLTITAGPAFTAKWLAPRMFLFAQAHPDIEMRFSASLRIMDFSRDGIDVAIRFGQGGKEENCFALPIIREWTTPMMTPELAAKYPNPTDLGNATLLHQDDIAFLNPRMDWAAWFKVAGLPAIPKQGPRFSQADHAIDAAEAHAGVILGRISLTEKSLREGRLVAPYALCLTVDAQYRFLCQSGAETREPVKTFLAWMQSELAALDAYKVGRKFVPANQFSES